MILRFEINTELPKLKVAGILSPPFEEDLNEASGKHIQAINSSGANLVMVALGCPKQELWMAEHSSKINAVLLGTGGAFPVYVKQ